ncbi:MAG: GerAB/ArcD/ProY family transporter [Oscillospiraceae bacterium]|nr:GerAB/ArcD/ProY family transporter [Oscillospiraceae bacterium]
MYEKMYTSKLGFWHAVAVLLVFYIGSGQVIGVSSGLGGDGWIAQFAGVVLAIPLLLILARLVRLMPEVGLYEMLEYTLGRWLAIIASILYFCYFLFLAASVRLYHGMFLQITSLPNTPLLVIFLALFVVCTYLAKSGTIVVGKWSMILVAVLVIFAVGLTLFAIPSMRLQNLLPMGASGGRAIAESGYRFALLPFGEAVVVLALLGGLERKVNPYKLFLVGAAVAVCFFALTFLRDAAILGGRSMDTLRYPHFQAASVIRVGGMETRIEFLATIPFVLAGVTKSAVCLIAAVGAVRWVFRWADGSRILLPVAILSVGLSMVLFGIRVEVFAIPVVHQIFLPMVQVGIPVLMWVGGEVKARGRPGNAED